MTLADPAVMLTMGSEGHFSRAFVPLPAARHLILVAQEPLEDQLVVAGDGIALVGLDSHVELSSDPRLDAIEHVRRLVLHEPQYLVSDPGEALYVLVRSALDPLDKPLLCFRVGDASIS